MNIPKSGWIIGHVYFKVKMVDNFREVMYNHLSENDTLDIHEFMDSGDIMELDIFCKSLAGKVVDMYQFPDSEDYFEKEDDNWCLPRQAFVLLEEES